MDDQVIKEDDIELLTKPVHTSSVHRLNSQTADQTKKKRCKFQSQQQKELVPLLTCSVGKDPTKP